eukprot:1194544-Prorocentrum_minimum.AAC.1
MNADAANTLATGDGLSTTPKLAGVTQRFTITSRDSLGNRVVVGGNNFQVRPRAGRGVRRASR